MAADTTHELDRARKRQKARRFGVFRVKLYLATLFGVGLLFAVIGLLERTLSAL